MGKTVNVDLSNPLVEQKQITLGLMGQNEVTE
jgi:hypothetical protein